MTAKERKKRGDSSLHLTAKKHPKSAVVATILGIASLLCFLVLCVFASQSHGQAGLLVGLLGLGCFALSLTGFILSWISLHKEEIRPLFPTLSAVINGLSIIFYLLLYIWGRFL